LNKKIIIIIFIFLILFAGIIAVTQEANSNIPSPERINDISSDWAKPPLWFRSNSGGMALEEINSRITALRNEYALLITFARQNEIPDFFMQYLDEECFPEIRALYKNGEKIKTQWILKDINGITRLNASFSEPENISTDMSGGASFSIGNEDLILNAFDTIDGKAGFIEIFNRDSFLITEYRFFDDGNLNRIDNEFNENLLIRSVYSRYDKDINIKLYEDLYRYNRSLSLRSIERIFYSGVNGEIDSMMISFPRRVMDSSDEADFIRGRINLYPEYFGGIIIENNKIVYDTDTRGRILSETLYDEDNNIVWVIQNIWENNRIVSSKKTEGDENYSTEYVYNSSGEKILERNFKNGRLERIVRREGNQDIEELYINDIMVMTAVWEDGRKISESRVR